jgi:phosphotransferase system HPr (HPr) family protein
MQDSVEEIEVVVAHAAGLHLRPAALFVQAAATFQSEIKARNVTRGGDYQNAKSALGIMLLNVTSGQTIAIQARGDDASHALAHLRALIERGFE